jgi:hypothetical protein
LSAGSGSSGSSSVFAGVFIAEEIGGIGDKTILEAFLIMGLRPACFNDEAFLSLTGKTWYYCLQMLDYQDFRIIRCWIKGMLL